MVRKNKDLNEKILEISKQMLGLEEDKAKLNETIT